MRFDAEQAARNNAHWCDIVCRSHGIRSQFDASAWVALRRSPPYYPDAVTLRPDVAPAWLLDRIDTSPGCSVKDSFATLDLVPAGFRLLFDAAWIRRAPAPHHAVAAGWRDVRTPAALRAFAAAHGGADALRPSLLDDPSVTILAAFDGDTPVGGAVATVTGAVVGLSNVFSRDGDPVSVWAGLVAAVGARYPDRVLVGYESGPDLDAARSVGFTTVGPLRVWRREA